MRFMMFMIPNLAAEDYMPTAEKVAEMTKYNEVLVAAGVLLAADGLHPLGAGDQVVFDSGKAAVKDGPYSEAKEVIGGYWMLQCKSKEEAEAWALRVPGDPNNVIEVRQVFEMDDFPADVQAAANPDLLS